MNRIFVAIIGLVAIVAAGATEPKQQPVQLTQWQSHAQNQSQMQNQGQQQSTAANSNSNSGASLQASERTVALGTTASIPYGDVPRCYLPANGIKRVRGVLFGALDLGAVVERDDACMADLEAERQHELALARAQAEIFKAQADADRAAAERIKVELECVVCGTGKR